MMKEERIYEFFMRRKDLRWDIGMIIVMNVHKMLQTKPFEVLLRFYKKKLK